VIEFTFAYLKMMKEEGPSNDAFDELSE